MKHEEVDVLRSGEWEVRPIEHAEGKAFIEQHHYSRSAANTSTVKHGLYRDGEMCGAILWMPPTKVTAQSVVRGTRFDWRQVLSCSRLAVHPDTPHNAASHLLGRSMRAIDREKWPALVTYADTGHGHTGSIYRATNWICFGEVPPSHGGIWIGPDGEQRGPKRGNRTLTVAEMKALGFTRLPNSPKIKFVHFTDEKARRFAAAKARGLQARKAAA